MKIKYQGPSVAVQINPTGDQWVTVGRGKSVEVPDEYGEAKVLQHDWSGGDSKENAVQSLRVAIPDLSEAAATALVGAGYREPADLESASDDDLDAVDGVGRATIAAIRAVVPAREDE